MQLVSSRTQLELVETKKNFTSKSQIYPSQGSTSRIHPFHSSLLLVSVRLLHSRLTRPHSGAYISWLQPSTETGWLPLGPACEFSGIRLSLASLARCLSPATVVQTVLAWPLRSLVALGLSYAVKG